MTGSDWRRAKELFSAALELPEASREEFLSAQPDAPAVIAEARSLLAHYNDSPDFLEGVTAVLPANEDEPASGFAGRRIGAWRLVREIGHGGMGVVWEARRDDGQFEQRAAVKLLRASLFTERDLRRFREERQILASLSHPSIARLLDGGMLEDGSPFLVMEYIDGFPIDQWCQSNQLDLRRRIELCIEVCAAVEYAHSQLVIHRDLKPANILVTREGEPKLLDFGIAKLLGESGDRAEATTRLLTPECASPEQVRGERMSTATDVFALGVLFYKLFTGRHPFAAPDANPLAALRAVCEREPKPPSSVAQAGRRELRGELDAIVLQALRKNPAGRYPSAHALAGDLRAWLDGMPVNAVPLPWWGRAAKLALRYKAQSAAALVAVLSLVAGIVFTSLAARTARRAEQTAVAERDRAAHAQRTAVAERDRAVAAENAAAQDRDRALSAEEAEAVEKNRAVAESRRADGEAANARTINEFLEKDLLAQASPNVQASLNTKPDPDLKVRTVLDRAADRIKGRFEGKPLVEASIQQTLGESYFDLGLYGEAQSHVERALELRRTTLQPDDPAVLNSTFLLGRIEERQAHYAPAETLLRQVLEAYRARRGDNDPETLTAKHGLATNLMMAGKLTEAEKMFAENLDARRRAMPRDDRELVHALAALADVYNAESKYPAAESTARESVELAGRVLGSEHPDTLFCERTLGTALLAQNKLPEAEKIDREILEAQKRVLGPEHPDTMSTLNELSIIEMLQGKFPEAIELLRALVATRQRVLGEEHSKTLSSISNLAYAYEHEGDFAAAEPLLKKRVDAGRRVDGEDHTNTLDAKDQLGELYRIQGRYAEAEPLFTQGLEGAKRTLGDQSKSAAVFLTALGVLYEDEGRDQLAGETLNQALTLDRNIFTPNNLTLRDCMTALGRLRLKQQRFAEAEALLRPVAGAKITKGAFAWILFDRKSLLGAALAGQGKYAEAEPLLLEGYEEMKKLGPAIAVDANLPEAGQRIVRLYEAWGKPEKAAEWRQKLASEQ
jgi:serine/threonine-protein kinase